MMRETHNMEKLLKYSSVFYKADRRFSEVTGSQKRFSTINSRSLSHGVLGCLQYFNDIFLFPGEELLHKHSPSIQQVILPVIGTLAYNDADIKDEYISADEILFLDKSHGDFTLHNPFEEDTINYIHFGLKRNKAGSETITGKPVNFKENNQLIPIDFEKSGNQVYASIGIYQGRVKGSYPLKNQANGAFAFIINGAFEVDERLMEHRDGLALWNLKDLEFEALSEFAIILILEVPLNQ